MSSPVSWPAIARHGADDVVVWRGGSPLRARNLLVHSRTLAAELPGNRYVLNRCEGRAAFLIGFIAAALAGKVTLLPANRTPAALAEIGRDFPDHCLLDDQRISALKSAMGDCGPCPEIAGDQLVAIIFTSGSTGRPQAHPKHWRTLVQTARLTAERFLPEERCYHIAATVPPQHMYGLETTAMLALAGGCAIGDGRPFFPQDIAAELAALPTPRVLITTPSHLRACVTAAVELPELALIISATAALSRELAAAAEAAWNVPVCEIYGCTEAGSMASRRTVASDVWEPFHGARIELRDDETLYCGEHLPEPVPLQDLIELAGPSGFRLTGRQSDLVKVAGKRASLADLTLRLQAVPGVVDGVVFVPLPDARPAALVVAPGLTRESILACLAEQLDAAFLPRPLVLVSALPRNEAGKLPRAALLAAIGATDA